MVGVVGPLKTASATTTASHESSSNTSEQVATNNSHFGLPCGEGVDVRQGEHVGQDHVLQAHLQEKAGGGGQQ